MGTVHELVARDSSRVPNPHSIMSNSIPNIALSLLVTCAAFSACQTSERPDPHRKETLSKPAPGTILSASDSTASGVLTEGSRAPAEASATRDRSPRAMASGAPLRRHGLAFPTGDKSTSAVFLEKITPAEVQFGEAFEYRLEVTNLTDHALEDVVVVDLIPAPLRIVNSVPPVEPGPDGAARWTLGRLDSRAQQTIQLSAIPQAIGDIRSCARVEYQSRVCSTISVVRAALRLERLVPAEALLGEEILAEYVLTNTGTGTARNITVLEQLPDGLVTADGEPVHFSIDALAAGEFRRLQVKLKAERRGEFGSTATANANSNVSAVSEQTITAIRQPVLAIEKAGPAKVFVGREITYDLVVKNIGDGTAREVRLENAVPAGAELVSVTDDGEETDGLIAWSLGELQPRAMRNVRFTVRTETPTALTSIAVVSAKSTAAVSATVKTNAVGIPAIRMEVTDLSDPVVVGDQVTYEIRVTNQGTAAGTAIKVLAGLEDTMTFIGATGATAATHAGGLLQFDTLETLAPKADATWRVTVRAATEGDVRFKVAMTSDQNKRPIEETEASRFYQ